jgi:hippurate hydrolase
MRLQTIVSREVAPIDTAVVTVGAIHAGTTSNIIAPEAELLMTVRTFSHTVRDRVLDAIHRIIRAEASASNAPAEPKIEIEMSYPVLINDPVATSRTIAAIGAEIGAEKLIEQPLIMGAEDFGTYGTVAGIPSVFWYVGGTDPDIYAKAEQAGRLDQDVPSNHSPYFAPVLDPTLETGIRTMVAAAREWLG